MSPRDFRDLALMDIADESTALRARLRDVDDDLRIYQELLSIALERLASAEKLLHRQRETIQTLTCLLEAKDRVQALSGTLSEPEVERAARALVRSLTGEGIER